MGSGKSTVGRLLAAQLAWHFVDLDTEIERHTGLPISQIFDQKGEPVFATSNMNVFHACLAGHRKGTRAWSSRSGAARLPSLATLLCFTMLIPRSALGSPLCGSIAQSSSYCNDVY